MMFLGSLISGLKNLFVEILNNLDEAPFLINIYSDGGIYIYRQDPISKRKCAADNWPVIKERWGGDSPTPSGIILVEEMKKDDAVYPDRENLGSSGMDYDSCSSSAQVWWILIEGKGLSCHTRCILKTSRMRGFQGSALSSVI